MGEKIYHWNLISSIVSDTLSPWMTTTDNDQIIEFKTADGTQRSVNSLTIWAEASDLYIGIGDTDYVVYVPSNSYLNLDYLYLKKITVLANAGIKLRYVAMYY